MQGNLGLSAAELGIGLFGASVGSVVSLPLAGWLLARYGSEWVTRLALLLFSAAVGLPALAANLPLLFLTLLVYAGIGGILDVAMNTQAAAVEAIYGRSIMSSFHALYSLGTMSGAALGGLVAGLGVPALPHLLALSAVLVVADFFVARRLLPVQIAPTERGSAFARPSRALIGLGIIAFCAVVSEGAMADWSAVYLSRSLNATAGLAAAGYATFSLAMAMLRFSGDRLIQRLGAVTMVRSGGLLAALGLGLALLVGQTWAALIGFGCVGLGLATIFPVVMSAAARIPNLTPGVAITMVATAGYSGFLAGPPLIGFVAQAFNLPLALGIVVISSAAIALFGGVVRVEKLEWQPEAPAAMAIEEIAS